MNNPLVSAVIPHYQNRRYLPHAVDSVLKQRYDPVEVVVVDSSDLDDPYASDDDRVTYVPQEPTGVVDALNCGIDEAQGDVLNFVGADDFLSPEKYQRQIPMIKYDIADIVYSDEFVITEEGLQYSESLPIRDKDSLHVDFFTNWGGVTARSVLLRAECVTDHRFDNSLDIYEDFHLWIRLFREYRVERIPEALSYKRDLEVSLSSDRDRAYKSGLRAIRDLAERYDDLAAVEDEAISTFNYRFAKRWLEKGESKKAAETARIAAQRTRFDPRAIVLAALAHSPLRPDQKSKVLGLLQKIRQWL